MAGEEHDPEVTAMLPPVPDAPDSHYPEPRYGHHAPAARWRTALDDASRWIVTHRTAFWSVVTVAAAAAMAGGYLAGAPAGADVPVQPPAAEASEKPTHRLDTPPAHRPTRPRSPRVKRPAPVVVQPRATRKKTAPTRSPTPSSAKPSKTPTPTAPPAKPSPTPTGTGTPPGPPKTPEPPNEEPG